MSVSCSVQYMSLPVVSHQLPLEVSATWWLVLNRSTYCTSVMSDDCKGEGVHPIATVGWVRGNLWLQSKEVERPWLLVRIPVWYSVKQNNIAQLRLAIAATTLTS